MRCQRCEFENIPGLEACMRCGSVLTAGSEPIDIHPPRMPSWKRPIRGFFRQLRQFMPVAAWSGDDLHSRAFPDWLRKVSRVGFFGAMLSFIPGLAHVIQKRFHTVRWWIVAWLVILLAALSFYGSPIGLILLGLAIGIHVWIAVHSALIDEYPQFNYRAVGFAIFLFFYFILYMAIGRLIFAGLQGGYASVDVPYAKIQHGDYLLGRPSQADPADITRGNFVLVELENVRGQRMGRRRGSAYAQVIGLGGDTVRISNRHFVVNDEVLDTERYPVQAWLPNELGSTVVPQDSYFISAQYRGTGYNMSQVLQVCIVNHDQIESKAFFRWMPLHRRGFIREY